MSKTAPVLGLAAALALAGAALAQPSGGPAAKGNAPLKPAHTVNDGGAKRGANSFTEGQARQHIEKSGFTDVTQLRRGDDGVWRGQAMRGGAQVGVAMDFKGNVSTTGAASAAEGVADASRASSSSTTTTRTASATAGAAHRGRHHHRRHRSRAACSAASPNGAACSGVDRNRNGVSDREDRAIRADGRT